MASPANANQTGGGGPFDTHKFFNPSTPPPSTSPNPNPHLNFSPPTTAPYNPQFPQYTNPPQQLPPIQPTNSGSELSDFSGSPNVGFAHSGSGPIRMLSSKLPKGRHLNGDQVVYDIDVRLPGEVQPQLEVTPITKYGSDPGLVLGRQIAAKNCSIINKLLQ